MEAGRRVDGRESLDIIRQRVNTQLGYLPKEFLSLHESINSPFVVADEITALMDTGAAARPA